MMQEIERKHTETADCCEFLQPLQELLIIFDQFLTCCYANVLPIERLYFIRCLDDDGK